MIINHKMVIQFTLKSTIKCKSTVKCTLVQRFLYKDFVKDLFILIFAQKNPQKTKKPCACVWGFFFLTNYKTTMSQRDIFHPNITQN